MTRQAKNEVAVSNAQASDGRYVSIFENPAEFAVRSEIARALSKTCFIPEAFRGKPEDCLVALDMAARLELNPIAVFSDIYVIDNRASFSSKFLIALVNRSGRFSRIQYEEGIDGEADVTFSGWGEQRGQRKTWKEKVPNYFATASFTELASGEVFTSPRVDLRFAEKNGWVSKNGSKWQTMPEIMCRYRAASILIKSVCPEIVMGLEWADDLQDAREEKPAARRVEVSRQSAPVALNAPPAGGESEAVVEVVDDEAFQSFGAQISAANDVNALNLVASAIADANLTRAQKETLRRVWSNRKKELSTPAHSLPPASGLPSETVLNTSAVMANIKAAVSIAALETIRDGLDEAIAAGQILPKDKDRILHTIDARAAELQDEEEGPPLPNPQQIEAERAKRADIQRFAEEGNLEELNFMRAAVFDSQYNGEITPQQAQLLTEEIETAVEGLQ